MRPKTWWQAVVGTFTNPEYYLRVVKAPFQFSLRFFGLMMIVLGISLAVRLNERLIPRLHQDLTASYQQLADHYPPDLVIDWDGNRLSSSSQEDIEVPYPIELENEPVLPATLAYLSPQELTLDQLDNHFDHSSWAVVTPNRLYINDLQTGWTSFELATLLDQEEAFTLDQQTVSNFSHRLQTETDHASSTLKKLTFVLSPLWLIGLRLWTSLLESILVFVVMRLYGLMVPFGKSYQLSLHLAVVAETVHQLSRWLYPSLDLPMFSIAFWLVFLYVMWSQREAFKKLKFKTNKK